MTTEAGKRLLALINANPPIGELLPEAVVAIEAEAVAAERARIAALEEALSDLVLYLEDVDPSPHDSCDPASCVLAEARRVLEGEPLP